MTVVAREIAGEGVGRVPAELPKRWSPAPLSRQVDLYKPLFERSGMCMANLDPELRVRDANADFFRQFGRRSATVHGRRFQDFLHPSVESNLRRQLTRLVDGQRTSFGDRMVAMRPDGSVFAGELTGIAAHAPDGRVGAVVVVIRPEAEDRQEARPAPDQAKILTDLDARILEGVAAGVSAVEMASRLYLSRQGVEYHVSTMFRKLGVSNRPALVSKAYSLGILSVGCWPPRVLPEYVK
ncbi:helix-turn-helix transcriptional regulator [Allokutzneria albata]|uniref:PAS domain S-box-containing protein n=1 Tax=Allokutzneria albata TaxID=211114 RepID=A0A1G9TSV2_ALLAB|nr:helix-turn-helix transcriptional regulator [Allokutzneria albata]SDM50810.1 PAS domain S-box-containing protein [Allokutzneria albata]